MLLRAIYTFIIVLLFSVCFSVYFSSCSESDSLLVDDLSDEHFLIQTHRGETIDFPHEFKGKTIVAGFIYTHCPDICPMTMVNLLQISELAKNDTSIAFCAITFDPKRDSVPVMLRFAELYNVATLPQWHLLTGKPLIIDSLMNRMRILITETEREKDNTNPNIYYLAHTDRITIIDKNGVVRKNVMGSEANPQEVYQTLTELYKK